MQYTSPLYFIVFCAINRYIHKKLNSDIQNIRYFTTFPLPHDYVIFFVFSLEIEIL